MIKLTNKNEPLEKEELEELLWQVKKGSLSARNTVIEHCLKFVVHIVNRFHTDYDPDDLFSIGVIGLTKGVEKYDIEKYGTKPFSTFVGRAIENEILMLLRKRKEIVISLGDRINDNQVSSGKDELLLEDILPSEEIDTLDALHRGEEIKALHRAISKLTKKEQYIIKSYFGIGDINNLDPRYFYSQSFGTNEQTLVQRQIGKNLNVSRSFVSRQIKDILEKLYNELSNNNLNNENVEKEKNILN